MRAQGPVRHDETNEMWAVVQHAPLLEKMSAFRSTSTNGACCTTAHSLFFSSRHTGPWARMARNASCMPSMSA